MKKFLSLLMCVILLLSLAACSEKSDIPEDNDSQNITSTEDDLIPDIDDGIPSDPENDYEETKPQEDEYDYDSGNLVPAEYRFGADDENYSLIKSMQGKFQHIENGGTDLTFVANNQWYAAKYGMFNHLSDVPSNTDRFKYFNNGSIGENLICFANGKLTIMNDQGKYRCNDILFDLNNDMFVPASDFDPASPYIVSKNGDWYEIDRWLAAEHDMESDESGYIQDADGKYNYVPQDKKPIGKIFTNDAIDENWQPIDGVEITGNVAKIFTITSKSNGYEVIILTKDGDMYFIGEIMKGDSEYDKTLKETVMLNYDVYTSTNKPILTNVANVFSHDLILATPIYSKIGDETGLYSYGAGDSLVDKEDNVEIKFVMPDGHKASEVVNVFSMYQNAIFVFSNGDVYLTAPMSEDSMFMVDAHGEYTMTKHEVLSNAMNTGDVKMLCSASTMLIDPCVYVLKNDGTLWACDMSDYD